MAENDTVAPGGEIHYYILAGSSTQPIDSIYGLVFNLAFNSMQTTDTPFVVFRNSALGTLGNDLYSLGFGNPYTPNIFGYACRTNLVNAYNMNDTIGDVYFTAAPSIITLETFQPTIREFKALTWNEYDVPFNYLSDPVVIDPLALSLNESSQSVITIYPNPVSKQFTIDNTGLKISSIEILNSLGENVYTLAVHAESCIVHCESFPSGVYFLKATSGKKIFYLKFIK